MKDHMLLKIVEVFKFFSIPADNSAIIVIITSFPTHKHNKQALDT